MAKSKKPGTFEKAERSRAARPPLYYVKSFGKVIDIVPERPRLSTYHGPDVEIWYWSSKLSMSLVARRFGGREVSHA